MSINLGANLIPITSVLGHLQLIRGTQEYEVQMPFLAIWGHWYVKTLQNFEVPDGVIAANPDQYAEIDLKFGQNLGPTISEDGVWSIFGQARDQIAEYWIPYDILFNSNSYVNTLLNIVGVEAADVVVAPNLVTGGNGFSPFPGIDKDAAVNWTVKYDISGDAGANILIGGDGQDIFRGLEGVDFIEGGAGHDRLYANTDSQFHDGASDYLTGGAGRDTFYVGSDISATALIDRATYQYNTAARGTFDIIRDYNQLDTLNISFADAQTGLGFAVSDFTYSLGQSYQFAGRTAYEVSSSSNALLGALSDSYFDPNLNETISVLIFYELESYVPVFALEQASVSLRSVELSTSFFIGSEGDDVVTGTGIDQEFQGLGGNDTFDGAGGDDVFYASDADGQDIYIGGDGRDTLMIEVTENLSVDVSAGTVTGSITSVTDTFSGIEAFHGGSGDDTFVDGDIAQYYDGGSGVDTLAFERAVDDYRIYASGDGYAIQRSYLGNEIAFESRWLHFENIEQISFVGIAANLAQAAVQTLEGTSADETIIGTTANEDIYGHEGDDTINGGEGNDILIGGNGNDNLNGGNGHDALAGGLGNDVLDGGSGDDVASYNGIATDYTFTLNIDGSTTVQNATYGTDTLLGIEKVSFSDDSSVYDLIDLNSSGPNIITGTSGDEYLVGTFGNDEISGLAGDDHLDGLDGDDVLLGGDGNDTLNGGAGDDVLAGGGGTYNQVDYQGARTDFSFIRNLDTSVTVTSAAWGTDTLTDINGVWFVGEAKWYDLDDLIDYNGFDTINTGTSGDDYLTGTAGNDAILGGEGNDTLYGGEGDDLLDGQGGTYNQVDYDGAASDYTFTRNSDDSITVSHATYGTDTLKNIDGVWFYGESAWYDLGALAPDPNTYVGTGNSGYFGGTAGDDTIIFTGGTGNYVSADAGNDVIVFSGNVADYNILGQGDHFTIENAAGTDAIQFTEVEYISFGDTGPVSLADIVANSTYSPGDTWFDPEPIGGLI
jgi:Ca2+-binding RTX toxin-like protein